MIVYDEKNKLFHIKTRDTSYLFLIDEQGHIEHLHYGPSLSHIEDVSSLRYNYDFELGSATSYSKDTKSIMLNHKLLEVSTYGKGDYREPTIHLELDDGNRTVDFTYDSHEVIHNHEIKGMPQFDKTETLVIHLTDDTNHLSLDLYYTPFDEHNAIVRSMTLTNDRDTSIVLDKILSMSLDMVDNQYRL